MSGATLARDDSRMLSKSSLPSAYDGATARPCVTVKVEPSDAEKRPVDGVADPVAKCVTAFTVRYGAPPRQYADSDFLTAEPSSLRA